MEQKLDGLVLEALHAAVQQDGECRLVTRGKTKPGLLPSGRSKAKDAAVAKCLDPEAGLFDVREAEEGSGKQKKTVHFVTVTRYGVETLLENHPLAERMALLDSVAAPHRDVAVDACLRSAQQEMSQFGRRRNELLQQEEETLEFIQRVAGGRLGQIREEQSRVDRIVAELKRLEEHFAVPERGQASELEEPADGEQKSHRPRVEPRSEDELDFQRDQCEELVYAWQDAEDPETRDALERVMLNVGLEPVGETGETVGFDGRLHVGQEPLEPGQSAVVHEPGWRLVNARGNYLIVRARVDKHPVLERATADVRDDQH